MDLGLDKKLCEFFFNEEKHIFLVYFSIDATSVLDPKTIRSVDLDPDLLSGSRKEKIISKNRNAMF
jgi:hypothetical protein